MPSTYSPNYQDGNGTGKAWFQDVEINPATLADGSLRQRFDPVKYPQLGDVGDAKVGRTKIVLVLNPATPAALASVTLTATVTGVGNANGTVQFKDGSTAIGAPVALAGGVATKTVGAGFAAGAHSVTAVYSGDPENPSVTSAAAAFTAA
jgi:hypothetical protein